MHRTTVQFKNEPEAYGVAQPFLVSLFVSNDDCTTVESLFNNDSENDDDDGRPAK